MSRETRHRGTFPKHPCSLTGRPGRWDWTPSESGFGWSGREKSRPDRRPQSKLPPPPTPIHVEATTDESYDAADFQYDQRDTEKKGIIMNQRLDRVHERDYTAATVGGLKYRRIVAIKPAGSYAKAPKEECLANADCPGRRGRGGQQAAIEYYILVGLLQPIREGPSRFFDAALVRRIRLIAGSTTPAIHCGRFERHTSRAASGPKHQAPISQCPHWQGRVEYRTNGQEVGENLPGDEVPPALRGSCWA